jgi:formyltetrahydrofolate dehydrogenase
MMKVYIYGAEDAPVLPIVAACRRGIEETTGCSITQNLQRADLAVAPLLTRLLSLHDIYTPYQGTLVFHPSLLPRHRGADAIKWAYKLGEKYTGATWFWPDEGTDTGDICEQEVLAIPEGAPPRVFYEGAVIPAAVRMLERILADLKRGIVRRVPQREESATYEPRLAARARDKGGG